MNEMAELRGRIDTLESRHAVRGAMCRDRCMLELGSRTELKDCFSEGAERAEFFGFIDGRRASATRALDRC